MIHKRGKQLETSLFDMIMITDGSGLVPGTSILAHTLGLFQAGLHSVLVLNPLPVYRNRSSIQWIPVFHF